MNFPDAYLCAFARALSFRHGTRHCGHVPSSADTVDAVYAFIIDATTCDAGRVRRLDSFASKCVT
ncbi:hypothetical protein BURMUCGD1_1818 [Burkholderia multivorans CGD1]|nr:hypothetical protein BURMUCGD1_1818 [Burkholderia multivorans CGD1]